MAEPPPNLCCDRKTLSQTFMACFIGLKDSHFKANLYWLLSRYAVPSGGSHVCGMPPPPWSTVYSMETRTAD